MTHCAVPTGELVGETPSPPPYLVPAAPVWAAVRRRQSAWGFSDEEMIDHLGLAGARVVDTRDWMARTLAERILRRLAMPARATAGTQAASLHLALVEASPRAVSDAERARINDELRGVPPPAAAQSVAS